MKILIIVENLPVPFDRRVWQEATTLKNNGHIVSIICPVMRGYNKRFEIYSHTLQFQHELDSNELTPETHRKFIEVKQSSIFLFNPKDKIHESLNEIHKRAFKVIGFREHSSKIKDTPEFITMSNESQESLNWIMSEIDQLHIKLSKYLNFHK